MQKKIRILLMIGILTGIIIGSQKMGEYLYGEMKEKNNIETMANSTGLLVIIDAGHGGKDPGKVGINNVLEKDVNLNISKKLKTCLEKEGVEVILTREDENSLSESKVEDLKTRVSVINEKKPVLAVSIHQNSYPDSAIKGAQVFYYTHSKEGKKAAEILQKALICADESNKRQEKPNDTYYMLKKTEPPVIIIECGFLSNYEEAERLNTEEYQQILAETIAGGIMKYISGEK